MPQKNKKQGNRLSVIGFNFLFELLITRLPIIPLLALSYNLDNGHHITPYYKTFPMELLNNLGIDLIEQVMIRPY